MEKIDKINFRGRRLENNQNLRQNEAVSKLHSHAKGKKAGVKYSPINQFIKGFSSRMAVNSYLNDNVEGKKFYFSFGSIFNSTKFKFRLKVAI